jgi:hypothetical protein
VKLNSRGDPLQLDDPIIWVEIANPFSKDKNAETLRRERGELTLSILDLDIDQSTVEFAIGDSIAIIDCQTFIPEHIPVLKALENQKRQYLPFNNGRLLNIGAVPRNPNDFESLRSDLSMSTDELVARLVDSSQLDPIVQIRRDPEARSTLTRKLISLVEGATLDVGQLESFIAAMTHEVHCTQGPPGTGKVIIFS